MTEERISPFAPDDARDAQRDAENDADAQNGAANGVAEDAAQNGNDEVLESVEALRAALDEARRAQLRAVADYQNLQRRAQEQRSEFGRYQLTAMVMNFLPVLDDLERAVESTDEAAPAGWEEGRDRPWVEGIRLVLQKFRGVLEASGVREIAAEGQPFNPERHEAAGSAPGPEGQVVTVLRRGYELDDRVVRPAMVMVGAGDGAPVE